MRKLGEYFLVGVLRVWVVDDSSGSVFAHRSQTELVRYGQEEILVDEELLPGFSLRVSEIFRNLRLTGYLDD
jgi:Uma2 family endonuclease